jgi:hypothetical protein
MTPIIEFDIQLGKENHDVIEDRIEDTRLVIDDACAFVIINVLIKNITIISSTKTVNKQEIKEGIGLSFSF